MHAVCNQARNGTQPRTAPPIDVDPHSNVEWLETWLATIVQPSARPRTYRTYRSVANSLIAELGSIKLQALAPADLQHHYSTRKLKPRTVKLHHAILRTALEAAVDNGYVDRNVALKAKGRPKIVKSVDAPTANCWTANEARQFFAVTRSAGARIAAMYATLLDSGMRISECAGLKWGDVNFATGTVQIARQLVSPTPQADGSFLFGPVKNGNHAPWNWPPRRSRY